MFTLRFSHFWPTTSLLHAVRAHLSVFPIFGLLWLIQRRVEEPLLPLRTNHVCPSLQSLRTNSVKKLRHLVISSLNVPLLRCDSYFHMASWAGHSRQAYSAATPARQPTPPCVVAVGSVAGPSSVIIGDWCFITRGDSSILKENE